MILASALRDAHEVTAWLMIGTNALAGAWCFAAHKREKFRRREIWWFVALAQVLVSIQAAIGVAVQNAEDLEPNSFHYLYGFSAIVAVAILYGYRQQLREFQYALYAGGSFFIMGLGIRAMYLGANIPG